MQEGFKFLLLIGLIEPSYVPRAKNHGGCFVGLVPLAALSMAFSSWILSTLYLFCLRRCSTSSIIICSLGQTTSSFIFCFPLVRFLAAEACSIYSIALGWSFSTGTTSVLLASITGSAAVCWPWVCLTLYCGCFCCFLLLGLGLAWAGTSVLVFLHVSLCFPICRQSWQ